MAHPRIDDKRRLVLGQVIGLDDLWLRLGRVKFRLDPLRLGFWFRLGRRRKLGLFGRIDRLGLGRLLGFGLGRNVLDFGSGSGSGWRNRPSSLSVASCSTWRMQSSSLSRCWVMSRAGNGGSMARNCATRAVRAFS